MSKTDTSAPGTPGIMARWTSSAKTGVGTSISGNSHVWFTLSHGIFNEIYYPHVDQPCTRDMGLIVTDGKDFFSEEKRNSHPVVHWLADGVPAFQMVNECDEGRYRIEKQVLTDPHSDTVLQHTRFVPLKGSLADYHLYVLLAPHIAGQGEDNTAWIEAYNGIPMLFAERDNIVLALACNIPWLKMSAGFVGISDGWKDLHAHKQMEWEYRNAENGNVALTAEIDISKSNGDFVIAVSFGKTKSEAAETAINSLKVGFDKAKQDYISEWEQWFRNQVGGNDVQEQGDLSKISLAVIRTHESKSLPGGFIASLSTPWGFSKGDKDLSGYHLIWSRDMVEAAGGLLAAGATEDVLKALEYLESTQESDGHWPQNMWSDGTPYWQGIQMDETALPILLVDLAKRENLLREKDLTKYWPMVRKAVRYLVHNGPVSPQDRWEEDPGYSPFTVGAEIAALLVSAEFADLNHEANMASYLRETADVWNSSIDRWIYIINSDWAKKFNVPGYYCRIESSSPGSKFSNSQNDVHVKNVAAAEDTRTAKHMISPDSLALVRFGLRSPNDTRIQNTLKLIDSLLKIDTPCGSTWHRYNDDGYGEHENGTPFDGTGIGRGWPLLTGERGHYELAAGRTDKAKSLLSTMERFSNDSGLISEQVWDSAEIPEHDLKKGRPSGSAMPLVWAHAEYLKLRRSIHDGHVFDLPPQTVKRYLTDKIESPRIIWRFNHKLRSMPAGKILRIETMSPAVVHWSDDGWKTFTDLKTHESCLGIHLADVPTQTIPEGNQIDFTFYWPESNTWESTNFKVIIRPDELISTHSEV